MDLVAVGTRWLKVVVVVEEVVGMVAGFVVPFFPVSWSEEEREREG